VAFKSMFVLGLQYPAPAHSSWAFVQKAVYGLAHRFNRIPSKVFELLTEARRSGEELATSTSERMTSGGRLSNATTTVTNKINSSTQKPAVKTSYAGKMSANRVKLKIGVVRSGLDTDQMLHLANPISASSNPSASATTSNVALMPFLEQHACHITCIFTTTYP